MKKLLVSTLILVIAFSFTNAQESTSSNDLDPIFSEGDKVINLGVGLGSTLYTGSGYSGLVPPLSISFEKGIKDNILEKGVLGVGGYVGYASAKWDYSDTFGSYSWSYSNIIIGARGSFHYPLVDKLDTYAGLMIGYNIVSTKYSATGYYSDYPASTNSSGGLAWSMYLGGRYWFNPKIAGMVELGYGIAYLNLGVALKL